MTIKKQRARERIGRDPNYTLARTKTMKARQPQSAMDALIDADYPRVDPEEAIQTALRRIDNWT